MENSLGQPIRSYKNQKQEGQNLPCISEYDKAGQFNFVASMALKIFKVPVALVVFFDHKRAALLNKTDGVSGALQLNSLAILRGVISFYENAGEEVFLLANPLVATGFGFHFYAAAPLITPNGMHIGSITILDKEVRDFQDSDKTVFYNLAAFVVEEIQRRRFLTISI